MKKVADKTYAATRAAAAAAAAHARRVNFATLAGLTRPLL